MKCGADVRRRARQRPLERGMILQTGIITSNFGNSILRKLPVNLGSVLWAGERAKADLQTYESQLWEPLGVHNQNNPPCYELLQLVHEKQKANE